MYFSWWNVNFICFLCFFLFFWLTYWNNLISYFISNQISCCFCSFLNYSFRSSLFLSLLQNRLFFFTMFITEFSCKWQKAISFYVFSKSWFCWIYHFCNVYPIIKVKLTLSSISSALLAWSVNQTSKEKNSVLTVFITVKENSEIFINCPNCLFGTKLNKTFDVCW